VVNISTGKTASKTIDQYLKKTEEFTNPKNIFSKRNLIKMNKKRVKHDFKMGDMVLIKSTKIGKIDPFYCGSFKIIEINVDKERYCVEVWSRKLVWYNVKNIKPFWRARCTDRTFSNK
jgi:hypothetical protein